MHPAELCAALARPPWEPFGLSVEGRAIVARKLGGTGEAPAILMFGAIHGDEPLGADCLWRFAEEPAVTVSARPVWVVPVANPDGFLVGKKDNARGVDLNRNFPAANWRRAHAPGYDPGEQAASEPETRALMELVARTSATRLIALHSPFRTVNYDGPARALAERMAAQNGYGTSDDIGYPTPGSFGSFYGRDLGLEVVTLEIPPLAPDDAWLENRTALLAALDCPVGGAA